MTTPHDAIGRKAVFRDRIDPWRAAALHAALDADGAPPAAGDALPAFQHWIYFLEARPARDLGRDGHPAKGGFIPDLSLPRRMWAGGRLSFHRPLLIGEEAEKTTTIEAIESKAGRTGPLAFVTLRHEIAGAAGLSVTERQDVVYRTDPAPGAPKPAPVQAPVDEDARRAFSLGPTALFRYSALTFNGHRIHYDRDYASDVEGYPGLVVHGPLIAQLMLALGEETFGPAATFDFRARSPVFDFETFEVCSKAAAGGAALWARGPDGRLAMSGTMSSA
ncbi:MAG: MaoC family dehydratase N-terminal domain-containing protein [Pseudomonadota bacterium]